MFKENCGSGSEFTASSKEEEMTKEAKKGEGTFVPKKADFEKLKKLTGERSPTLVKRGQEPPKPRLFRKACKCGGDITEDFFLEHNPMSGPPILGPGSKQQRRYTSSGLYCNKCGICYEFVPDK